MHHFSLPSFYTEALKTRFTSPRRPLIGLTGNFAEGETRLAKAYYHQVELAGGTPVIIPPSADATAIASTLDAIDGLLLTGGADINPLWQGDMPSPHLHAINSERDLAELLTIRMAYDRGIPMLGICRGMQAIAMALGGKVIQDIYEQESGSEKCISKREEGEAKQSSVDADTAAALSETSLPLMKHSQDGPRNEATHMVKVCPDSVLSHIYDGAETLYVNSMHHQAVGCTGNLFHVVATAPDGIIEAMESNCHRPALAVQWHPECLEAGGAPLFRWLNEQALRYRRARTVHTQVLTLDTHCDTPMFFAEGADFRTRDNRIKVDLYKMVDGGVDAATMVAYIPQRETSPFSYANAQLDRIEEQVNGSEGRMALARTADELRVNKQHGVRSILRAVENGNALEGKIENVAHFAGRGIIYITLVHNGDNDVCDSAKGERTHGGVSAFGREVIGEMNRLGLMVDLSHASEESFYDALDISSTPIVCSHSNCRALCDHPRNLTDEQLRALAKKGGVAHITLYPGFLSATGEPSILNALEHLNHAVSIMGIEHVGIGTDFDGDGGICGFNDASEAINFTMHLLGKRYSQADIEKIWGGNWLRLMEQIQKEK